ncbi:T9SS type A sorting domain-containing protein [candidate division KSB1 bacterium]|nr:T9SS type A sorting domain-containing protein [candidate division KSB1 bacterium]
MYGVSGIPHAQFGGYLQDIGGGNTYPRYLSIYNQIVDDDSPLEIELTMYTNATGGVDIDASIDLTGDITTPNNKLVFILTNYFSDTYFCTVTRYSDEDFTLTSAGETGDFSHSFDLDPSWDLENIKAVVIVQTFSGNYVIHQAGMISVEALPNLSIVSHSLTDDGNGDGRPDPGETAQMVVTLGNVPGSQPADSVVATLYTPDPEISFIVDTVTYPVIPPDSVAGNSAEPFIFSVDASLQPHVVDFTLAISAQPGNYQDTMAFSFMVGRPEIILVDDDGGDDFEVYYIGITESLGRIIDRWENATQGLIPQDEIWRYSKVVWFTGDVTTNTLTPGEQDLLAAYLEGGGNLFLSSQNAGDEIGDSSFFTEYLHAQQGLDNVATWYLTPVTGDPIGDPYGLDSLLFLAGGDGAGGPSSSSSIIPLEGAVPVYLYRNTSNVAAIRYANESYRVVFFSFPFESIGGSMTPYGQSTLRDSVLARILAWFDAPMGVDDGVDVGIPTAFLLDQNYPNPFNAITCIPYEIPQPGGVQLKIYNTRGKVLRTLVVEDQPAGRHYLFFDASQYASGIYFYQLKFQGSVASRKMLLIK